MFRRWKKAVLVMWLTWDWKERVGSRMTPRLRTLVEGVTVEPSIFMDMFWVERVRVSGPMMRISDLLQLSFKKFFCIQVLTSVRQVVMVDKVVGVMVLEGR